MHITKTTDGRWNPAPADDIETQLEVFRLEIAAGAPKAPLTDRRKQAIITQMNLLGTARRLGTTTQELLQSTLSPCELFDLEIHEFQDLFWYLQGKERGAIRLALGDETFTDVRVSVWWPGEIHPTHAGQWYASGRCDRLAFRRRLHAPRLLIEGRPAEARYFAHSSRRGDTPDSIADVYHFEGFDPFPFARDDWQKLCLAKLNCPTSNPISERVEKILDDVRSVGFTVVRIAYALDHLAVVEFIARRDAHCVRAMGSDDDQAAVRLAAATNRRRWAR